MNREKYTALLTIRDVFAPSAMKKPTLNTPVVRLINDVFPEIAKTVECYCDAQVQSFDYATEIVEFFEEKAKEILEEALED